MRKLAQHGAAVMAISSDLPEVLGISDRVLVMSDGKIVAEFGHGASETEVMHAATEAHLDPAGWRNAVLTHGIGESASRILSSEDVGVEALLMGLRVRDGLPDRRVPWGQINEKEHKDLILNGFLESNTTGLRLTDQGRPVVNAVINRLLS